MFFMPFDGSAVVWVLLCFGVGFGLWWVHVLFWWSGWLFLVGWAACFLGLVWVFSEFGLFLESLILAQDERWRRA